MTYSRKRYWLAMTAALVVAIATKILFGWLHPGTVWGGAIAMTTLAMCFALGLLAYSSQDEIQHQNSMRAWYWGGCLAIIFALMPFVLITSNAMLVMMVDLLAHLGRGAASHAPKVYFVLGVMIAILTQGIGFYLARIVLRLRS